MIRRAIIDAKHAGGRLDDTLAVIFDGISKSEARRIIDRGGCSLSGAMVRVASRRVKAGETVEVGVMEPGRFAELVLPPEALLYEDHDLVAVNKPAGINTQRTPYQLKGTLEYWVAEHLRMQGVQEPARVIHRLDRGTSGAMVFPKNRAAAAWLSRCFHDGLVGKRYLAAVTGAVAQEAWRVEGAIGKIGSARYGIVAQGRTAVTEFRRLALSDGSALIEALPLTGRTHQIRVHLASCGLPIIGDTTYGGASSNRMMLHCYSLCFRNPAGTEIVIKAGLDASFEACLVEKRIQLID